jgi:hypothetical protein
MIKSRQAMQTVLLAGPFTVLLHPADDDVESNVALPTLPDIRAPVTWLESLQAAFTSMVASRRSTGSKSTHHNWRIRFSTPPVSREVYASAPPRVGQIRLLIGEDTG